MVDHHTRTRNWLSDLAEINQEIERSGLPAPVRKTRLARKLKPLWEE